MSCNLNDCKKENSAVKFQVRISRDNIMQLLSPEQQKITKEIKVVDIRKNRDEDVIISCLALPEPCSGTNIIYCLDFSQLERKIDFD